MSNINEKIFMADRIAMKSNGVTTIIEEKGEDSTIPGYVRVRNKHRDRIITSKMFPNKLLISGRVYFSEKAINRRSNFRPPSIDQDFGISGALTLNNTNLIQEDIIGIMVGIGGTTPIYGEIKDVEIHKKTVPTPVPFRIVTTTTDLTTAEKAKYLLRVVQGNKVSYYGKKFDSVTTKVLYANGTEVPLNVHTLTNPDDIRVFNEYIVSIDGKEFREYFIQEYGDSALCQINSIGLLTGYPENVNGNIEYRNVRCITTSNMAQNPLKDEFSTIDFTYEQLIR